MCQNVKLEINSKVYLIQLFGGRKCCEPCCPICETFHHGQEFIVQGQLMVYTRCPQCGLCLKCQYTSLIDSGVEFKVISAEESRLMWDKVKVYFF